VTPHDFLADQSGTIAPISEGGRLPHARLAGCPRAGSLTPLGRQLRDDLRPVCAGLHDSLERARPAAQGIAAVLRVGMLPVNVHELRAYGDAFRARHPGWRLRIRHPAFSDPFGALRRGDVDVLVAWLPVEEPGLTVGPAPYAEPRVLAVGAGHEPAGRTSGSLDVVIDFRHPDVESRPDYWFDSYVPSHARNGRSIQRGPLVQNTEEILSSPDVRPRPAQRGRDRAHPGPRPGRPRPGAL
jgi:DNA-binding transcriptional LysR family regulator